MRQKKRHFKIVKIDETRFWADDIAKHGPICGVYLYDEAEITHCCELTPSYYLYFLYSILDHDREVPEEIVEEIDETDMMMENQDIYVHCHQIDPDPLPLSPTPPGRKMIEIVHDCGEFKIEKSQTYQDVLEGVLEYYRCNHVV